MEIFIVLFIGSVLIVVLNNLPEHGGGTKHPINSVKKFFEGFSDKSSFHEETDKEKKDRLLALADKYLAENNLNEAEKTYLEVLKIDEKDTQSYKGLGQICFKEEDYKDAHDIFQKLIKLVPEDASNYCNLGMCCFKEKNFSGAVKNYEKALTIEKKSHYYKNLGIVQLKLKKYNESARSFLEVLSKNGGDEESFRLLSSILGEIKDKKLAKKSALMLLEIEPDNAVLKRESSRL